MPTPEEIGDAFVAASMQSGVEALTEAVKRFKGSNLHILEAAFQANVTDQAVDVAFNLTTVVSQELRDLVTAIKVDSEKLREDSINAFIELRAQLDLLTDEDIEG